MSVDQAPVTQQRVPFSSFNRLIILFCLYEVNLSMLFQDEDINRKLSLSLASVSNNLFNESYFMPLSAHPNPRRCLYVLIGGLTGPCDCNNSCFQEIAIFVWLDTIESWKKLDSPTVYCAIQVYLEGEISNPSNEDENVRNVIGYTFSKHYLPLKDKSLVGAQIVQLFQISNASKFKIQDGYGSTALDMLTSMYDGKESTNLIEEGALVNPQKKWEKIHYIGTYIHLTVNDVARWEGYHFFLFFAGIIWVPKTKDPLDKMQACIMIKLLHDYEVISEDDQTCSVPALIQQSRYTFARHLSSIFSDLDGEFARRLFKSLYSLMLPIKPPAESKLWLWNNVEKVEAFVESPEAFMKSPQNFKLMVNLVDDLAMVYFNGRLPIKLSDEEAIILIQTGLQKRQSNSGQ